MGELLSRVTITKFTRKSLLFFFVRVVELLHKEWSRCQKLIDLQATNKEEKNDLQQLWTSKMKL